MSMFSFCLPSVVKRVKSLQQHCKFKYFLSSPHFHTSRNASAIMAEINTSNISKRLSLNDPNSFSNPESIVVEHMDLDWKVDFDRKIVSGSVTYNLQKLDSSADKIILDTSGLSIAGATTKDGQKLDFTLGEQIGTFGKPLTVQLNNSSSFKIEYETTTNCTALQWLNKSLTKGKRHPYVFSQCQAIHARSLLPCQDTPFVKASYHAKITTPKELQALMSAVVDLSKTETAGNFKTYYFKQVIPIQSYLIAIAVGDIKGKAIGPRSTVWAEQEILEAAAEEFSDTENFISTGEKLMGDYVWGTYDILILPPSFPYGGMENPCLTFVTPTLLAGDKSLVNVVAHEISHSWTGNLVTNKNFEHFWLNEGFTVYAERLILKEMKKSEPFRQFEFIGGWKTLSDTIKTLGADNPLTKLVPDLTGVDPDDAFSSVPYEKGSCFLYHLEEIVGYEMFTAFFKMYIQKFAKKSIETKDFVQLFEETFPVAKVDWQSWLHTSGMPPTKPKYDTTLSEMCTKLSQKWIDTDGPFAKSDLQNFDSTQVVEFLSELIDNDRSLSIEKIKIMEQVYGFGASRNCEILFRWLRLCTRVNYALEETLTFLSSQGRMKYVRPLYRELYASENRAKAIEHFQKTRNFYFPICENLVVKDLKL